MNNELANQIYDILIDECGASPELRKGFVQYLCDLDGYRKEWRFMGLLGFGGKFYAERNGCGWRVDCYREDRTPERESVIGRANKLLNELERPVSVSGR